MFKKAVIQARSESRCGLRLCVECERPRPPLYRNQDIDDKEQDLDNYVQLDLGPRVYVLAVNVETLTQG